jgi:hypothetical protein
MAVGEEGGGDDASRFTTMAVGEEGDSDVTLGDALAIPANEKDLNDELNGLIQTKSSRWS